ncbi:YdiU family protein [Bacillus lacus]|uniref:Protein nucleotidyltransferase YdiU n=1 Tax=Metabacillus lacus TaxID=1983721 RepID=A0A7X2J3G1_9BACI|nr:YdiU family protein [Metabacillus lacus]MRX74083.1 YdiU family protein [Metabacillus lacus]
MTKQPGWKLKSSYTALPERFYSIIKVNPVSSPELLVLNAPLAEELGLDDEALQSEEAVAVFAGNEVPKGSVPFAQAYAGHQFGHFTMLGDGRALMVGEQETPEGKLYDIQLKGSGRTPYSRGGDGRAALGPMLREYIISEAMHALGIPTTRSLAVVATGEPVYRETALPGAIMTRVASSHIRVGTFEYAAGGGSAEELKALADYTLKRHFPHVDTDGDQYLSLLREVVKVQASLIAKWQLVGFIHGVMNTDNMTISGETIDYGPCAFMDAYDPATVFSSIDAQGRYAYSNQPGIGGWNLARFAEALLPLLHEDQEEAVKLAQDAVSEYPEVFHQNWLSGMRAKLGLFNEEAGDKALIEDLLSMMHEQKADFTNTFRALAEGELEEIQIKNDEGFQVWHQQWKERLGRQEETEEASARLMKSSNPAVIPRNHIVEEALQAAVEEGDLTVLGRLLDVLQNPYEDNMEKDYCRQPAPAGMPYQTYCGT